MFGMNATTNKPNVTKVEILWSENNTLNNLRPDFPSLLVADIALAGIAIRKQLDSGYDKTGFRITFSDGETYEGRLDLTRNEYSIREHVHSFLRFYAGIAYPTHLTKEQYDSFLARQTAEQKAECVAWLNDREWN
jgi:hypothetical protein